MTQDKQALPERDLAVVSDEKFQAHQLTSSSATGPLSARKSQHIFARQTPSAIQHSSDYTTAAGMHSADADSICVSCAIAYG